MRIFYITIFVLFSFKCYSQVGVNTTTPDASSILDIVSSNKGLLIPRVALLSTTNNTLPIPSPVTSLLVYNIANVADVTPGYYFWNGSVWEKFSTGSSSGSGFWSLSGNSVTGTDFLGTTNYQPLQFKVDNVNVGRIHPLGGINFGINSLSNINSAFAFGDSANASGVESFAIGDEATSSASKSMAFGSNASANATESVAIGTFSSTSAYRATSVGALSSASATESIACGVSAVASGVNSSSFGYESTANGIGSTSIGYRANTSQNYAVVIGETGSLLSKVGIGTSAPDEKLHVVGNFKYVDGNQAAGKILQSNASGVANWVDLNSLSSYGEVVKSTDVSLNIGNISTTNSGVLQNVSNSGGVLQVHNAGIYKISFNVNLTKAAGTGSSSGYVCLADWSGVEYPNTRTYFTVKENENLSVGLSTMMNLAAWSGIQLYSSFTDVNTTVIANGTVLNAEKKN